MSTDPPRNFGKYQLLDEIGRGGMGVVYRARQIDLDRTVAIKLILAQFVRSPEHVERLAVEAQAAARVSHANVVSVIETGEFHGQHFIAMEYVPGRSLDQAILDPEVQLIELVRLLVDVARAVQHLHEQGILHLDIKPSNILVAEDGRAVVTDFGLAQILTTGAGPQAGANVGGTPGYIAPELLRESSAGPNPLCDVYSLGVVLYEAVTRRRMFTESQAFSRLLHSFDKEPDPPRVIAPSTPRPLETVILKSIDRRPARRYQSANALGKELERWLAGEPIEAVPVMGWYRIRRWIRRHPALASRLLILVAFLLLTLGNTIAQTVEAEFLRNVTIWLGMWGAVSAACEFLPARRDPSRQASFLWACADAAVLTVVLFEADGVRSPLILVYPLMVVNAGFWVRVSLVVWVATLALLSYGLVWIDSARWRLDNDVPLDRHVLFVIVVLLTGVVVGMQVRRLRSITRHYAKRLR